MSAEDDELFAQFMRDVTPLHPDQHIAAQIKATHKSKQSQQHTRRKSRASKPVHRMEAPREVGNYRLCAHGVSDKKLKQLQSGLLPVEYTLDLHGMTQDASLAALETAFHLAFQDGKRVVRIIHGKGLHSPGGQGILKRLTYDWLKHGSMAGYVLAATPCPQSGSGACLVLLRRDKSRRFGL